MAQRNEEGGIRNSESVEEPQYSPFLLKLAATPFLTTTTPAEAEQARAMLRMAMGAPRRAMGPKRKTNLDAAPRDQLRRWMEERGWSLREAARELGVQPMEVNRYLAGKREENGRPLTKRLRERMRAAIAAKAKAEKGKAESGIRNPEPVEQ